MNSLHVEDYHESRLKRNGHVVEGEMLVRRILATDKFWFYNPEKVIL